MLKLQFVDGSRESIWLVEPRLRIGKHKDNNVILDQPFIEDFHAEIRLQNEQLFLLNLKPENIVGVNNKKVNKAVKIGEGDTIIIGKAKFKVITPSAEYIPVPEETEKVDESEWGLQATASWAEQSFYPVKDTVTIGRDESCDITVPVSHLSRRHAQLTVAGGYMVIKDLGSTNGTYLNGEKITQGRAKPGDKVRFDVVTFSVTGPKVDANQTIVRPGVAFSPPPGVNQADTSGVARKATSTAVSAEKQREVEHKDSDTPMPEAATAAATVAPHKKSSMLIYAILGFALVFGGLSAFFLLK